MPRKTIPCAFSCTAEFLRKIDARAASLGMNRSQYILQVLRKDLFSGNQNLSIVGEQSAPYPAATPRRRRPSHPAASD